MRGSDRWDAEERRESLAEDENDKRLTVEGQERDHRMSNGEFKFLGYHNVESGADTPAKHAGRCSLPMSDFLLSDVTPIIHLECRTALSSRLEFNPFG